MSLINTMQNATPLVIQQVKELLVLQDKFNTQVNPDWKTANQDWDTAVICESAEMMESYGYKWWKKQTPDMDNVRLEIIDIYHFITSFVIQDWTPTTEDLAKVIAGSMASAKLDQNTKFARENYSMIYYMLDSNPHCMFKCFASLCVLAELSWEDLYKGYVAKNALNAFRANNGYKQGTYNKIWGGNGVDTFHEDNYFLMEYLKTVDLTQVESLYDNAYNYLQSTYRTVQTN